MSLWGTILRAFGREDNTSAGPENVENGTTNTGGSAAVPPSSNPTNNSASTNIPPSPGRRGDYSYLVYGTSDRFSLSVATVYRCVKLLSDSVANLPVRPMRKKNDIFVVDENSRLNYLLNVQPDNYINAFDFWEKVIQDVLLAGNAYIVPIYNKITFQLDRLALCNPHSVSHDTISDTYTVYDLENGVSGTFSEDMMIHIKGLSLDNKQGLSVLTFARLTLNTAATGDNENLKRFANGGNVRGIVSNDKSVKGFGEYQDSEIRKTAVDIDTRFQNGENVVGMPGNVDFKSVTLSSTDMQFLESRKFTVREICRFFGVHPSFVFDDTSNNYKSAEMANVAFLSNTLNPLLRQIENELLRKLVAPALFAKRKFKFDRSELYATNLDSKVKYQAQTIAAGIYTVNEWRQKENKLPVEGGDNVLVSANLRGIQEALTAPANTDPKTTEKTKDNDKDKDKDDETEDD